MAGLIDTLEQAPNVLIVAAAVVTAVGIIWRKVVQPVRQWFRQFRAWMERIEHGMTWVETQMKPNGGSSLTDRVNATAKAVEDMRADVLMLLDHDAERDTVGHRYGPDHNQEDT